MPIPKPPRQHLRNGSQLPPEQLLQQRNPTVDSPPTLGHHLEGATLLIAEHLSSQPSPKPRRRDIHLQHANDHILGLDVRLPEARGQGIQLPKVRQRDDGHLVDAHAVVDVEERREDAALEDARRGQAAEGKDLVADVGAGLVLVVHDGRVVRVHGPVGALVVVDVATQGVARALQRVQEALGADVQAVGGAGRDGALGCDLAFGQGAEVVQCAEGRGVAAGVQEEAGVCAEDLLDHPHAGEVAVRGELDDGGGAVVDEFLQRRRECSSGRLFQVPRRQRDEGAIRILLLRSQPRDHEVRPRVHFPHAAYQLALLLVVGLVYAHGVDPQVALRQHGRFVAQHALRAVQEAVLQEEMQVVGYGQGLLVDGDGRHWRRVTPAVGEGGEAVACVGCGCEVVHGAVYVGSGAAGEDVQEADGAWGEGFVGVGIITLRRRHGCMRESFQCGFIVVGTWKVEYQEVGKSV